MSTRNDQDLHDLVIALHTKQNIANLLLALILPTVIAYHVWEHQQIERLALQTQSNQAAIDTLNSHGSKFTQARAEHHHNDAARRCHFNGQEKR